MDPMINFCLCSILLAHRFQMVYSDVKLCFDAQVSLPLFGNFLVKIELQKEVYPVGKL